MANVVIIDYGMGNLRSVSKALELVGAKVTVTPDPSALDNATHVVLPGVGAFQDAMDGLRKQGLIDPIREAIASGRPFLGICLGLQLLFEHSSEDGSHEGLGILPGDVVRFPSEVNGESLIIPHMGWNQIHIRNANPLLRDISSGSYVYFVHSYYVRPANADDAATVTDYGLDFCSMAHRGNIFATQFHPEKSQAIGLCILRNFVALTPAFC